MKYKKIIKSDEVLKSVTVEKAFDGSEPVFVGEPIKFIDVPSVMVKKIFNEYTETNEFKEDFKKKFTNYIRYGSFQEPEEESNERSDFIDNLYNSTVQKVEFVGGSSMGKTKTICKTLGCCGNTEVSFVEPPKDNTEIIFFSKVPEMTFEVIHAPTEEEIKNRKEVLKYKKEQNRLYYQKFNKKGKK